jgi:hypothetical protein
MNLEVKEEYINKLNKIIKNHIKRYGFKKTSNKDFKKIFE